MGSNNTYWRLTFNHKLGFLVYRNIESLVLKTLECCSKRMFQIRYFWAAKERVNILLCTGVLATKTIRNIVNPVISLISKKISNKHRADSCIEHKLQKKWESIIYQTKRYNKSLKSSRDWESSLIQGCLKESLIKKVISVVP